MSYDQQNQTGFLKSIKGSEKTKRPDFYFLFTARSSSMKPIMKNETCMSFDAR